MCALAIGERAPDFTIQDCLGERFQLAAATTPVALIFLRYTGCSLCRDAMSQLSARYLELVSKGAEALVFVPSPTSIAEEFHQKHTLPFRLFSDPERRVYQLYGVHEDRFLLSTARQLSVRSIMSAARSTVKHGHGLPEGTERQRIGTFVIDAEGILRYRYVADSILEELPLDALMQAVDALPPRRFTSIT